MNKTTIHLHGKLGKLFGHQHSFAISSPCEAIKALRANFRGFDKEMAKAIEDGFDYTIVVDGNKVEDLAQFQLKKQISEIHIVPTIVVKGGIGMMFSMLGNLVSAGIGALFSGGFLSQLIVAAAIYGLSAILFKPPKPPPMTQKVSAGANSYFFGGRGNTAQQGQALPVGYGRLKIGSSIVHSAIRNYDLATVKVDNKFNLTITESV
jgi:predicted phage tail protein